MDLLGSANEFFHEAVTSALRKQHVEATGPTEFYLVNLLVDFMKARDVGEEPLALKLASLAEVPTTQRARGLKEIGDTSLYMSGFFADSLARKMVDVDYYVAMGGAAYGQLASLTGNKARDVFTELAVKFGGFVEVLARIRGEMNFAGGGNLLRIYEAWVKTGGDWLAKRLRDTGLIPSEAAEQLTREKKILH